MAGSAIRVDHLNKEILISKSFAKVAANIKSKQYKALSRVRAANPDYEVKQREIKTNPNKETYAGLTYEFMRDYIILHTLPENELTAVAEFDELLLISRCHTKATRYTIVKRWFLTKYPELTKFKECYLEAMDQIMAKYEDDMVA